MGSSKGSIKGRSKGVYLWVVVWDLLRVIVMVGVNVYIYGSY